MNKSFEYWLNFVKESKLNETGDNVVPTDTLDKLQAYISTNPVSDQQVQSEDELHDVTMQLFANLDITGAHQDVVDRAKDLVANNISLMYDRSIIGDRNLNWQANLDNKHNETMTYHDIVNLVGWKTLFKIKSLSKEEAKKELEITRDTKGNFLNNDQIQTIISEIIGYKESISIHTTTNDLIGKIVVLLDNIHVTHHDTREGNIKLVKGNKIKILEYLQIGNLFRIEFENKKYTISCDVLRAKCDLIDKHNESFTIDTLSASDSDKVTIFLDKERIKYEKEGSKITIDLDRDDFKAAVIMSHLHKVAKFDELRNKHNENIMKTLDKGQIYSIYNMKDNGKIMYTWAEYYGEKGGKHEFYPANQKDPEPFYLDNLEDYMFVKKALPVKKAA